MTYLDDRPDTESVNFLHANNPNLYLGLIFPSAHIVDEYDPLPRIDPSSHRLHSDPGHVSRSVDEFHPGSRSDGIPARTLRASVSLEILGSSHYTIDIYQVSLTGSN
jgi:hypothetical protein